MHSQVRRVSMVMPRKIPVEFGVPFPYGAYAVGEVAPVRDYDRSTKDNVVQQLDPDTGHPLWSIEVVDADPEAKKSNRTLSVKVAAKVQPVLPGKEDGSPFRQVEFDKLTATAYVEEVGDFSRIAWSYRAAEVRAASKGGKAATDRAVA
jgi:hypothetical protein